MTDKNEKLLKILIGLNIVTIILSVATLIIK